MPPVYRTRVRSRLGAEIRANPMADNNFRSDRKRDAIAEFARLIVQTEPSLGERAPDRFRGGTASDRHEEKPQLPPAPQLPADLNASEQAYEPDEHRHDDERYDADDQPFVRRSRSLAVVIATLGLALAGVACVLGYRSVLMTRSPIITATTEPNQITRASSDEPTAETRATASQVSSDTTGSIDKVVSHVEQATTIKPPNTSGSPRSVPTTTSAAGQALPNQAVRLGVPGPTPTIADFSQPAGANSNALVTRPVLGAYAVQVTADRSESRAQAAFRALQAKYPNQLSSHQPIIRRVDLGAAGVYYRALIGSFASAEKAAKLCSELKAAGGDCVIRKK